MNDERLSARYRALATEEPSVVLDDAIRAAARRGVTAGPMRLRPSRWAIPASIAAVLVLSFGVVLRMQEEQPGLETASMSQGYDVPQAKEDFAAKSELEPQVKEKKALADATATAPAPAAAPGPAPGQKPAPAKPAAAGARVATVPAAPPPLAASTPVASPPVASYQTPAASPSKVTAPATAASQPMPAPKVAEEVRVAPASPSVTSTDAARSQAAPTVSARPMPPAPAEPRAALTGALQKESAPARREDAQSLENRAKAVEAKETPERKLEKIVELRRAGRGREADEALARFRREHPDYKIPEATWERVK